MLKAIFKGAYDRESNEIITNYDHFSFVVIKQTAEPVFTIELSIFKSLKFNSIYSNRENIIQTFRMQPLSPRHEKKHFLQICEQLTCVNCQMKIEISISASS